MFEMISNAAEKLATNVSESRRGFIVRMGQAALGLAGVASGLLALPPQARAGQGGYCRVIPAVPPSRGGRGHPAYLSGDCVAADSGKCTVSPRPSSQCPQGAVPGSQVYNSCTYPCQFGTCFGLYVDTTRPCTF